MHPQSLLAESKVAHPVLFADPSRVLEVSRPGQSQRAPFEVPVGEHVGQAEGVVVVLGEQLQELLHPVAAPDEPVVRSVSPRVHLEQILYKSLVIMCSSNTVVY